MRPKRMRPKPDVQPSPATPPVEAAPALADEPFRAGDVWDAWLFAEADASLTLRAWFSAARADKAATYGLYAAALAREARAAEILTLLVGSDRKRR